PASFSVRYRRAAAGGPVTAAYVIQYRPQPGLPAEPARLVFTGRAAAEATVPFRLEGVDLK
ncbi:MAG: hypothetical protein ACRC33_09570, partial [Gemmataceae bacterium]